MLSWNQEIQWGALVISIFNDRVLTKVSTFQLLRKKSQRLECVCQPSQHFLWKDIIVFVNIVSVICHDLIHYHPTVRKAGKSPFFSAWHLAKNNGLPLKSQNSNSKAKGETGCWINSRQAESWFSGGYWRSSHTQTLWLLLCNNVRCHRLTKATHQTMCQYHQMGFSSKNIDNHFFLAKMPKVEREEIGSPTQKYHQLMDVSDRTVEVWVHGPEWKSQWFLLRSFQYFTVLNLSFVIALPSLQLITSWLLLDYRMTRVFWGTAYFFSFSSLCSSFFF